MEKTRKECYITINREKITVTKEVSMVWDQTRDKVFYQAHKEGTCKNNNFAVCCADCGRCRWNREGKKISLDNEKYHFHNNGKVGERNLLLTDKVPDPADIISEEDMARWILDYARKICPSGDVILHMYSEGYSTYEIAEETGIPQKTVYRRIQKLKQSLARIISAAEL